MEAQVVGDVPGVAHLCEVLTRNHVDRHRGLLRRTSRATGADDANLFQYGRDQLRPRCLGVRRGDRTGQGRSCEKARHVGEPRCAFSR